jgi:hypothetical protein
MFSLIRPSGLGLGLGLLLGLALALPVLAADVGAAAPNSDFQVSDDGASVVSLTQKLIWRRCVEGMAWNGKTCGGEAQRVGRAEALTLARDRAQAESLPWRVPTVRELRRLAAIAATTHGLDAKLFPASPDDWHWSSSSNVDGGGGFNPYNYNNIVKGLSGQSANQLGFLHGWIVNPGTGEARGNASKASKLPVRLVRSQS